MTLISRRSKYEFLLLLGLCVRVAIVFASDAPLDYIAYSGNHYNPYINYDSSKVQIGGFNSQYGLTSLSRTDLTYYIIDSGDEAQSTAVDFTITPTESNPYLVIYYALEIFWGYDGHDPAYIKLAAIDSRNDTVGCSFSFIAGDSIEDDQNHGITFTYFGKELYGGYLPWRNMVLDLSSYIGKKITIRAVAACCNTHHCRNSLFLCFDLFGIQHQCSYEESFLIKAPGDCKSYAWHKGSPDGHIVGTEKKINVSAENIDNYFCTIDNYCGETTIQMSEGISLYADFTCKVGCGDKDTLYITNNSYMQRGSSTAAKSLCDSYLWDFGNGQTSKEPNPAPIIYDEHKNYNISLLIKDKKGFCSQEKNQIVTIGTLIYSDKSDTICRKELPYFWRDKQIYEEGIHYDTLTNQWGCDSLRKLDLKVLDLSYDTMRYTIKKGDSIVWKGHLCKTDTMISVTYTNSVGCDSIVTMVLKVSESGGGSIFDRIDDVLDPQAYIPFVDSIDTVICFGDTLRWRHYVLTRDTMIRDTGYYWFGADSVYWKVDLKTTEKCACDTAYSHTYANIKEKEVPSFQWNGIPLNRVPQNERQDTILVAPLQKFDLSCDSIATLHLHVLFPCELPTETKPIRWKKEGER